MSRDLHDLLESTVDGPTRPLDATELVRKARRGTRLRRAGAVFGIAALVLVGVPVVSSLVDDVSSPGSLEVATLPDGSVPEGWVTLTAGGLAVSVPADWQVEVRDQIPPTPEGHPEPDYLGGPCSSDLYPVGSRQHPGAIVYPQPTSGACNLAGISTGPPPEPGIVLYEAIHSPDEGSPGESWLSGAEEAGGTVVIGHGVEMWRVDVEAAPGRFGGVYTEFVATDGSGGLLVSHIDSQLVQQVLETVRTP